jgi:hypothetical protein
MYINPHQQAENPYSHKAFLNVRRYSLYHRLIISIESNIGPRHSQISKFSEPNDSFYASSPSLAVCLLSNLASLCCLCSSNLLASSGSSIFLPASPRTLPNLLFFGLYGEDFSPMFISGDSTKPVSPSYQLKQSAFFETKSEKIRTNTILPVLGSIL